MQIPTLNFEREWKHLIANFNHSKGIRSIRIQIRTIRKGFEAFECKFEPFERDSKHSNANSNHSKGNRSIRIQIRTIRKGFEAFELNSNHSKGIRSIWMQIRTIRKRFESFWCKFQPFERNSKHSNANSNFKFWKGMEAFDCKF